MVRGRPRRNLERLRRAREAILRVGKLSGAVGTLANVAPGIEEEVCRDSAWAWIPVSTQIIQRDRHAAFVSRRWRSLRRPSRRSRPRSATCSAPRCGRRRSRSVRVRRAPRAMPHKRNPTVEQICGLARLVRALAAGAGERGALARAGHQPLLRRAGHPARLAPSCSTTCWPDRADRGGAGVYPGPHAREPRPTPRARLLPARAARADRAGWRARRPTRWCSARDARVGGAAARYLELLAADPDVTDGLGPADLKACFDPAGTCAMSTPSSGGRGWCA